MAGAELTWPWPGRKEDEGTHSMGRGWGDCEEGRRQVLTSMGLYFYEKIWKIAVLTYVQYIEKNVHVMIMWKFYFEDVQF